MKCKIFYNSFIVLLFSFLKYAYINKVHLSLSKKEIRQLQQDKFLKLVHFVAKNSPYYQKIIKTHNIDINNCKPEDFPVLTKKELIEEFDTIVTDKRITKIKLSKFLERSRNPQELFLNKYYVIHTSGSSGTISYYIYSQKELVEGASFAARADRIRLFQKVAFVAATQGHFAGATMVAAAKRLPFLYKQVSLFDINSPFADILEEQNKMQPTMVIGYALALRKLAEAQNEKKLNIKPCVLQSGGEPLGTEDKKYIQRAFHAPVINIYASSEHLFMGIGRDTFNGMYLMEDNLIFEIHKNFTCVTNLYNYTLPLIRYQMSDHLQPIPDRQNTMPFMKIKEVVGRDEHVPVFINDKGEEDFISPIVLVEFYIKNLRQFQIHIIDKKSFVFKAYLEPNITKEEIKITVRKIEKGLRDILREKLMTKVTFTVEIVGHLSADQKTRKFRLIVKKN